MRIFTNRRDIENAYNILINRLNESCDHQISVKLGHKGETIPCKINWSKPLGARARSNPPRPRSYGASVIPTLHPVVT